MLKHAFLAGLVLALSGTAALADSYYVVQDKKTMKCTVVTEKPDKTLLGINILGLEFGTKVEADNAVKTTKVCQTK